MNDGEYAVRLVDLPGDIGGAVRLSEDGFFNIYINAKLSPEAQRKAFDHEAKHIERGDLFNDRSIEECERS